MARIAINITTGKLKEDNLIVGIDLGTTNSLVAKMEDGQPVAVADFGKETIVPSLIYLAPDGSLIVGEDAKPYLLTDPARTIYSVKRLMGKTYGDIQQHANRFGYRIVDDPNDRDRLVKVEVDGRYHSPIELSALILKELKARAEHRLKVEVKQAVVTVPAYFNDAQRQATRDAGKLAGLDVLRIVNEPTAAALAYGIGLNPNQHQTVAVYDLGGGTFDITLLRIEEGIFEVLSTNGDTFLGGDDMDRAIVDHWLAQHAEPATVLDQDKHAGQAIRLAAEHAKKALTSADSYTHPEPILGHRLRLDRATFEQLIQPLVGRTLDACRRALADAKVTPDQVDEVILVGGSTRVPLVKQLVAELFQRPVERLHDQVNPDEVVALGAAVQADILAGNRQDLLLLDVTPLSLGIETAGGLMDVLIPRNSKVPARAGRQYTTSVDGQTGIHIRVFQGERELVADNRLLGEFHLRGIPAMPAGLPKVEVTFLIDADGILRVTAQELRSGIQTTVDIKPQAGLTDAAVEQMLLDSLTHAQTDVSQRLLVEARQEGTQLVYQAEKFLSINGHLLSEAETAQMRAQVAALQAAVADAAATKDSIHTQIDALDQLSRPFAHRAMDAAVQAAMVGKGLPAE